MQQRDPPPYYFFGVPLHNSRVAKQFCFIFILVLILPFGTFFGLRESLGEVGAGISAVVSIQFIIALYVLMIMKDPENFPNAEKYRQQLKEKKLKQELKKDEPQKSDDQKEQKQEKQQKQKVSKQKAKKD